MKSYVGNLSKEVHVLKNSSNRHEQLLLSDSIRIFGIAMSEDEPNPTDGGMVLSARAFLLADKVKGANVSNVIKSCYRAGKASLDKVRPPPSVVKLCSASLRLTIMRNKKTGMAPPPETDKSLGIKHFTVVEDLTGDSFGPWLVTLVWTKCVLSTATSASPSPGTLRQPSGGSNWCMTPLTKLSLPNLVRCLAMLK